MSNYDLELTRVIRTIQTSKAKKVCIQLPDGLKTKATQIAKKLETATKAKIHIWLGSNFGACDVPMHLKHLKFDLVVNFGHSKM
jgi:2-(3-amino-3-carboxypropyl)histidine synthase